MSYTMRRITCGLTWHSSIVMLPGWEASVGACREMERAKRRRIPIYHSVAECIRKETGR